MARRIPLTAFALSELKKELDAIFSKWVRLSNSNNDGYCFCITCEEKVFWLYIQNGHFISRSCLALRFDPNNTRPQCQPCNWAQMMGFGDNQKTFQFEENLADEIGEEGIKKLKEHRKDKVKYDSFWYIEKIEYYEKEVEKWLLKRPAKIYN